MTNGQSDIDKLKYISPRSWSRIAQDNDNFAYEATRAKAKFVYLMDKSDYHELIYNAADEIDWIAMWARLFNADNYDVKDTIRATLETANDDNDMLLKELCGKDQAHFAEFLLLSNDYHNAKVIIKSYILSKQNQDNTDLLEINIESFLNDNGALLYLRASIDIEALYQWLIARLENRKTTITIPTLLANYLNLVINKLMEIEQASVNSLANIDAYIDKAYYLHLLDLLRQPRYENCKELLSDYISIMADSSNLQSFYRSKKLDLDIDNFISEFVSGGTIKINRYLDIFDKNIDEVDSVDILDEENTLIKDLLELANKNNIRDFLAKFSLVRDNLLIRLAMKCKDILYGPEIIFGFWMLKKIEIVNLRIIQIGHELSLSTKKIEDDLRYTYGDQIYVW